MKCDVPGCNRDGLTERELRVHKNYYHKQAMAYEQPQKIVAGMCPDCGSTLFHHEGCANCPSCGYSKCG